MPPVGPPAPPTPPADTPAPSAYEESSPRHLVVELAEQAALDREIPLHVQITREAGQVSTRMKPFAVPEEGAQLTITVQAPGLQALSDLQQRLTVYPGSDSEVLHFPLRTLVPGLHWVTVRAFREGTPLGEVRCQISVTEGGVTRDGRKHVGTLPSIACEPGEVTLQVHRNDDESYSFQLMSETLYAPERFRFHGGDPRKVADQLAQEVRELARLAGPGAAGAAARTHRIYERLKNQGVELWRSAVPEAVKQQFWEQTDRITSFTVLEKRNVVPWELLYPLDSQRDRGFLAERLPVVRRVFDQDRVRRIAFPGATFVVPPGSPPEAVQEIASLRRLLGPRAAQAEVITEGQALTDLIRGGNVGLLHFACHNTFSRSGSRMTMGDGPFDPIDLSSAAQIGSLRAHRPLVFLNACRSAGDIEWWSEALGWPLKFLEAGAGAFIGTLWSVRSDSALLFAETFYDQFLDGGESLGQASLAARQAVRDQRGDPTWLAYAVYGSPAATASRPGHPEQTRGFLMGEGA